jgi:hypothetical protein
VHKRIISAVKRVEFVSDRMSCIILRGHWCLNNVRREASRYFKNKKREYLINKINDLATISKNKNIGDLCRGLKECKRGYQLRDNLVKDENGDLLADSHNILNRWKNYFSQLLDVHNVSDVR